MTRYSSSIAAAAAGVLLLAGCSSSSGGSSAGAEGVDYPTRDMAFIVPYGTGGSTDPIGRQYAGQLAEMWDTNVVVENREGGSATIGTTAVVTANPDGYTIGLSSNSALVFQPLLSADLPYQSTADYQPLIKLADVPTVLTVAADAPWQTVEEFVAAATADPSGIRVSVSGALTSPDLVMQEFNRVADVELTTVPFTGGGGEALTALLSGEVEANAGYGASVQGQVEAGELRVLGVFYEGTYDLFPEAQSIPDSGYDVTLPTSYYTVAPADLEEGVLAKLVQASEEIVASADFEEFAEQNGYILDPITTDEVTAELDELEATYEELLEYIGG